MRFKGVIAVSEGKWTVGGCASVSFFFFLLLKGKRDGARDLYQRWVRAKGDSGDGYLRRLFVVRAEQVGEDGIEKWSIAQG